MVAGLVGLWSRQKLGAIAPSMWKRKTLFRRNANIYEAPNIGITLGKCFSLLLV